MKDALAPAQLTVWLSPEDVEAPENAASVVCIDQRYLPFEYRELTITTPGEMAAAISDMVVRGAGCIGVSAAYGMYLAAVATRSVSSAAVADASLKESAAELESSRPTAVNLAWATRSMLDATLGIADPEVRINKARTTAESIAADDIAMCAAIGQHGLTLIAEIYARTGTTVNLMTHCNAGWLAFVKHGTATAPMYAAHAAGIPIHVYVSETRPRNQGARLTAWELATAGIDITVIADNSAGHLLQRGLVDLVIVGSDRTTIAGDVANKVGTYMKAVVAHANGVPFYAALPSSTLDPTMRDGIVNIPIEERGADEVTQAQGWLADGGSDGELVDVQTSAPGVAALNIGFDVTPAAFVTGIITERGICAAAEDAILGLYPEMAGRAG